VDLFSGCGAGSLGFRKAGFEIVAALDSDSSACLNYALNLGLFPIRNDIRRVSGKDVLNAAGLGRGEVDVLVGCPPCQGFSFLKRTRRKKGLRDRRNSLVATFVERVRQIRPKVAVFENVAGILYGSHRRYLNLLTAGLSRAGYVTACGAVNAADYGVPQFRIRTIALAAEREQLSKPLSLPSPTHFDPAQAAPGGRSWVTVRQAIGDLPPLAPGEKSRDFPNHDAPLHRESTLRVIKSVPKDGGSRRNLPKSLWLPCHLKLNDRNQRGAESVYGRMRWDEPSSTITTGCHQPSCGRFIHPEQDRAITLREAARLQTIPDDFVFEGSKEQIGIQIGNAMPMKLAQVLARQVLVYLN